MLSFMKANDDLVMDFIRESHPTMFGIVKKPDESDAPQATVEEVQPTEES